MSLPGIQELDYVKAKRTKNGIDITYRPVPENIIIKVIPDEKIPSALGGARVEYYGPPEWEEAIYHMWEQSGGSTELIPVTLK